MLGQRVRRKKPNIALPEIHTNTIEPIPNGLMISLYLLTRN